MHFVWHHDGGNSWKVTSFSDILLHLSRNLNKTEMFYIASNLPCRHTQRRIYIRNRVRSLDRHRPTTWSPLPTSLEYIIPKKWWSPLFGAIHFFIAAPVSIFWICYWYMFEYSLTNLVWISRWRHRVLPSNRIFSQWKFLFIQALTIKSIESPRL